MVRVHQGPPFLFAGMAELEDALDLGSSVIDVQVQLLLPAPLKIEMASKSWRSMYNKNTYFNEN